MASQLLGALSSGFTSKQIMDFLLRKFPQHSDKIKDALKAGFTVEQVIKFLGGGREAVNQISPSTTEHEQTRDIDIQRGQDVNQMALKGAGAAALAGGAALGAPMLQSALQRAAPQLMGPGSIIGGSNPLKGQNTTPIGQPPTTPISPQSSVSLPQQPPSLVSPSIPNVPAPVQPEGISNIPELIKKHGFEKQIEAVSKNVKDPKGVAAILFNKFPKEMQKLQKEAGKPMEDVVAEYMQSNVKPLDTVESEPKAPMTREEALGKFRDNLIAKHSTIEPIKKGETVASPQGIGEIKEIRNGKAIIEVDGKKHQINEDELIQSPIPEKDLGELFEELQGEIEKQTGKQISRNVEYAAYSPENNELLYKPHSGAFYVYENIPPEIADELVNLMTKRRTSGENHIGAWEKGSESPIGSRMYDLIQQLQSIMGGKGKEYRGKYQTIYDALEPAREAKKRLHEERKKKAKKPRLD